MNTPLEVVRVEEAGAPSFDQWLFGPPQRDYAVCIFVVNEGEKVRRQLQGMASLASLVDIYVCDGGSTDGSLDLEFLQSVGVRGLLVNRGARGLGSQMRMGFWRMCSLGYKGVVTMDGNGKDGYAAIPRFLAALEAGDDHLQGSRYVPGGHWENTPFLRHWGVQLLHAPLLSLAAGFRYTDTTNGFRAYSRRFLLDPRVAVFRDVFTGYELHYYLAVRAARLGFVCREIPVSRVYPAKGKVPTKISFFRGNLGVLSKLFRVVFGCYNPPKDALV
jgi:dolichol-phosphate mannosyltransferase